MTPNELLETAVRKYPLGHPIISMALAEYNFWHGYPSGSSLDEADPAESDIDGCYILEAVLDELPDIPPRIGDCAELLEM